jgi:hypothetical protein
MFVYKSYCLLFISTLSSNLDNTKNLLAGGVSGATSNP